MNQTVVYCRDCTKELYRIAHSSEDKSSQCPYCKSTKKFYFKLGEVNEQSTHTAYMLKNKQRAVVEII